MKVEQYLIKNYSDMDSMHDSYAAEIRVENECLIIVYDKLDEGVSGEDGQAYYKNKKLTVKYEFQSYCDAVIYHKKHRYLRIDMVAELNKFNKITKNCIFRSYKYSVDSFNELTLRFSIRKIINGKYHKYKYSELDINTDAVKITYIWE